MSRILNIIFYIILGTVLSINKGYAYSPFVKNYKNTDYKAASQNWAIKQSSDKKIYVGNHYGLLEFDGWNWRMYVPNTPTAVRSIYIDKNDRIYVGLNEGFGYYNKNQFGELEYVSLSDNLDRAELVNKQIWSIEPIGEDIYFQTFSGYFTLRPNKEITFTKTVEQLYLFQPINSQLYIPEKNNLFKFDGKKLEKQVSLNSDYRIKSLIPYRDDNGILVVTEANGIWLNNGREFSKWENEVDKELEWAIPNRATITRDSLILIGTILNGVYALNFDGALAWHINNKNGLQNNTVLGIIADAENNIWLALDNGISVIYNTRSLKVKRWNNKDVGAIYDVVDFNNKIHIATNQGLFVLNENRPNTENTSVELIKGTEGYILDLYKTSDNKLLVGHGNSTLLMDNQNKITKWTDTGGGMCTKELVLNGEELLFQSSYTTINIYKKANGNWVLRNKLDGFSNAIQFFVVGDSETIWAASASKGLTKIKTDKEYKKVLSAEYISSLDSTTADKIGVFGIKNRVVFTDQQRCYTYDDLNNTIVPYDLLNDNIGHFNKARRIIQVDKDNYWFVTGKDAALISFEDSKPRIISTIFFDDYDFTTLDDFENIVSLDKNSSILCYNNGLAQIQHNGASESFEYDIDLSLAWATAFNRQNSEDSIKLVISPNELVEIPYSHNSLHFGISLPIFEEKHSFRYTLKGLSGETQLSNRAYIEYMRLPHGKYTLLVEAINRKDQIVKSSIYDFVIKPPFYMSAWAYLTYALLVLLAIYFVSFLAKKREINRNKKQRLKQRQEIIKLENDKLQNENTYKSKELASYAMSMIRQTEILTALKIEFEEQKQQLGTQYPNKYYNKIMSMIDTNLSSDEEWEVFQTNFDRIHENFFRNLRKKYPDLTSSDLKLCALLRLNLDTKQIANMMNITVRAIETRRYRMRRKLNLDPNDSLTEFLIDFKE